MNTIQHHFTSVESEDFFSSLSTVLQANPDPGNIQIPSFNGTGFISRRLINGSIVLLNWNIRLNRDLVFVKKLLMRSPEDQVFIISYMLNTDGIMIRNSSGQRSRLKGNRNILFMSADANLQFEVPKGETLKAVTICVPLQWLKTELRGGDPGFVDFIERLGEKDHPTVFMETSPPAEYRLLTEMNANALHAERGGELALKAKVYSLVADFFSRIFDHASREELETRMVVHHEKMMEVEMFLKKHLETSLPEISAIARNMTMSVSTLKRHFKMMFGKSIYEYYLELKMDHARELLVERSLSVNEVANLLDYEKVSCFIDIFKKHHGYSPGAIRKKLA